MPIECSHPRPELNMPNRASGASRVTFSVPPIIPGLGAEANRVLQAAFRSIAENLARLSSRGATVPLVDAVTYARDGQTITGTASGGEVIVLPQPPAEDGVRIVLDSVGGDVSVIAPDGTQTTISTPGVYDFAPTGDPTGTYETPPGAPVLASMTSPRVLGRETAGNGAVEQLTVQGGLELNGGLQIADNGVLLGKLVGAPNAGFVGSTGLGDYEHLTRATVAAAFASTSIVAVGTELQRAAVTGDVIVLQNSNTAVINTDAVDNTKLANMAQDRIKGRSSGAGTGDPQDLTAAQVVTIIANAMGGVLASTSIVQVGTELRRAAVTGDVEIPANSNTATIPAGTVENSQLQNMTGPTFKARVTGTGSPENVSPAAVVGMLEALITGRLLDVSIYYSSTTHNYQADTNNVLFLIQGGGGGGGGSVTGEGNQGGGGGAGSFLLGFGATSGSSSTVTVGSGGTAGSSSGGNGGNGGTSSMTGVAGTSTYSAPGGSGGTGGTGSGLFREGGAGGGITTPPTATFATMLGSPGQPGGFGQYNSGGPSWGGDGGSAALGGGGKGGWVDTTGNEAGGTASTRGAGGGGAVCLGSTGVAGGAGAGGYVLILEFT